jgi:Transglutaminase-like superfamily
MWKTFQRYRALEPEARALFRDTVFLMPRISMSLHVRGFQKTQRALQQKLSSTTHKSPNGNEDAQYAVQTTCRMVRAGAQYGLIRPSCLVESLTLWYLLRRQSLPATLRIGVRKPAGKFEAHAWVECEGIALNQPAEPHQHYAAFDSGLCELQDDRP